MYRGAIFTLDGVLLNINKTDLENIWAEENGLRIDKRDLLPGGLELLKVLREKGIKVALCSLGQGTHTILERLQINDYFEAVVDKAQFEGAQGDARSFLLAAEKLGLEPWDCAAFVAVETGIISAKQAGMYFYRQLGYDYFPFEINPNFIPKQELAADDTAVYSKGVRNWINEHEGPIRRIEDVVDDANWPSPDNLFDYQLFAGICDLLPEGMKIIGGAAGGPFEHACFLMGSENLFVAIYDDEALVVRLFERIGQSLAEIAKRLVQYEKLGIYRFGDDLGYKSATMLSPEMLRKYVFPWQKKVVLEAHKAGKAFILHSCGQLQEVMDDLIDDVGIDAKHSFEDAIMPVTEAKKRWGRRIAILGGVDVDFLCRRTPGEVKNYTLKILEECSKNGGYAIGTGNTVTNYIPVKNYLAMLEAAREFNGN